MLRLRLFRKDDPSSQIDARALDEGELVIGRDAKADWAIADPDRGISRRHLIVANRGGLVTLRDTSSNGVFLGDGRDRVPQDRAVPIERGEAIRFGGYILVLEEGDAPAPAILPDMTPFSRTDDRQAAAEGPARHPFASALKADPFSGTGEVGREDVWERRPAASAGSWDAKRHVPEHTELIGTDRRWAAPPPTPAADTGYGFDTPFERPILERPAAPNTAAIPSDWMDASAADAPALEAAVPSRSEDELAPLQPEAARPTPAAEPVPPLREEAALPEPEPELLLDKPRSVAAAAVAAASGDDALFQHFCAGAGLDSRHFAGEDRDRVMERLGAVYRQMVLGIADLMRDRTTLRNEYRMVHTAVQPEGNNPFKWVPPQRIAVELLREEGGGYITGERALNDALGDVKAHLLCTLAGMRAALSTTFDALAPAQVEARLGGRTYLMAVQRDAALWAEYAAMADTLRAEAEDNPDGLVNRAFRQGYEEQAAEIIGAGRSWR